MKQEALAELIEGVKASRRRALARAITLVESKRATDRALALQMMDKLEPSAKRGLRIGISGAPGVGKSTLLEQLGQHMIREGCRPAVLAIDPSSDRTGGSLLGDKTRMQALSAESQAYVRPSPSGQWGGGIAAATANTLELCECAGFGPCLVETVGVGQAETAVVGVVDLLVVLLEPGAGDELQGAKRGLLEWADLVVVNKADGERLQLAQETKAEYAAALSLFRHSSEPIDVLLSSSASGEGVPELWEHLKRIAATLEREGAMKVRRGRQLRLQFREGLRREALARLVSSESLEEVEKRVITGEVSVAAAIQEILDA